MEKITFKKIYNELINNKEIIKIYEKIEQKEIKDGGWAFHNINHIQNVTSIAERILKELNYDEETIYKCKIACFLHDIGALQGKENHAQRSYEYAKELLKKYDIYGIDEILDAIKNHSEGFDSNNIITLSIILADKLDIKKTRISEEGKKVEGNRQYQHIEDIIINIKDNTLIINFITDGKMNIEEVNNYYFTLKVFKAIESFTKQININYKILMDNKEWSI